MNFLASKALFPLFTFISTLITIHFVYRGNANVSNTTITLVSSALSAAMFVFLEFFAGVSFWWKPIRSIMDNNSKFEGVWFEYYIDSNNKYKSEKSLTYAVFRIRYSGNKQERYV